MQTLGHTHTKWRIQQQPEWRMLGCLHPENIHGTPAYTGATESGPNHTSWHIRRGLLGRELARSQARYHPERILGTPACTAGMRSARTDTRWRNPVQE